MKINKTLIILSLLLIFCISLGAVSAADNTDMSVNDINNDDVTTVESSVNDDEINIVSDGEIHYSSEIYDEILNATGTYNITNDYQINKTWEIPNANVIIEGNNHTIYGNGKQAFNILGKNVTIKNLNFVNCSASSSSSAGGAINMGSGSVSGCSFVGCSAKERGGAIYFGGSGSVSCCSFVNCSAHDYGGAIYFDNRVSVNYCIFDNNIANYGNAIYSVLDAVNLDYNFFGFQNNVTNFTSGLVYGPIPTHWVVLNINRVNNSYLVSFVLNNGSALDEFMPDYTALLNINGDVKEITIKNNNFNDTYVTGDYVLNSPNTGNVLVRTYFDPYDDSFTALNNLINNSENNTIVLNYDYKFYNDFDTEFKDGITISKNNLVIDGNGYTIDGSNLARVFNVNGTNVTIKNINFINTNSSGHGGAIYFSNGGSVVNCSFVSCKALNGYGGAISFGFSDSSVSGCGFVNCSASQEGGGAISFGAKGVVSDCSFMNTTARIGGAIYFWSGGSVNYCIFENNNASVGKVIYGGLNDYSFNFFSFKNNIGFPNDLIGNELGSIIPNSWVVLDVTHSDDSYFVKFVTNEGNSLSKSMPEYTACLSINGVAKEILIKNNAYNDSYVDGNYVVTSLNSGNVLANVTFKNDTNCSMNVSVDDVIYGEDVIIDVALPVDAIGNVTLFVNNLNITKSVVEGKVSFNVSDLGAGVHTFTLKYSGDDKYPSKQYTSSFNVEKYTSTTTVSASDVSYGSDVTVNVTLDVVNGTGDIIYYLNGNEYATKDISDLGLVIKNLSARTYYLTVEYSGDLNNTKSSAKCNFTVSKNNTYIMSTSAINITYGEDVIINVTLPDDATGYVEVVLADVDGNEQTYIGAVKNGTVIITVSGLDSGIYTVKVTYAGDNKYTPMSDNALFKVNKGNAFIDVNVNPVSYGDYHELTILVPIDVTGYVNVTVNNKTYTAYVVYGEAIVDIDDSILDEGSYEAKVTLYDPNYNEFSTSIELVVFKADSDFNVEGSTVNYGENSTIAVEVIVPSGDNGKVYIDGIPYDLIDGKATIDLGKYSAGEYNITVYYVPSNNNYWDANCFAYLIVNKVMAEIAVNVSDIIYGEDAVITVSVPVDVTGTVKYYVDGVEYGTQDVGDLSPFSVSDLTAGVHQVMIVYSGDNNYNQTIKETSLVVNKTGLTFDVSVEDITYGEDAVIGVSVPVDVTGTVKYYVDGILYETQNVEDISPVVVSYLKPGYHPVMIVYSGDDNYNKTIKETGFTVNSTSILDSSIVVDNVSCNLGSSVDLVAHVVGDNGYVTFYVNDVELNSVKLVDGIAKLTYYANATGNFVVKAVYSGSDLYNPSENTSTLVVNSSKFESNVSVDSVVITKGSSVNLVAHLDSDATGFVTFYVNGSKIGISEVEEGVAKFAYVPNNVGKFTIKAVYAGDDKYLSSSATGDLTVKEISKLGTTLSAFTLTITAYTSKNLVVTLKDSNGKVLSGKKLTIALNGKTYNVTTNASGQAKLGITSKVVKNYTATIKFAGDNSYTASSKSVKVVIKPAYVTVADIIKAAKTLKSYSSKNKKLPSTIKVGSYKLTHAQLTYLMTVAIKHIKAGKKTSTKVKVINVKYTAYNAKISKKIMKKGYLSVVNTLYSKGVKGTLPKYFTYGGKKIGYNPYAYSLDKILAFYSSKHRLPNYCVFVNY